MVRWRRTYASWHLVPLIPWVVLTLLAGGVHNHAGLTRGLCAGRAGPAESCFAPPPDGHGNSSLSAERSPGRAPNPCLACLWQMTTRGDVSVDPPAEQDPVVTPPATVPDLPVVTTALASPGARAPPCL